MFTYQGNKSYERSRKRNRLWKANSREKKMLFVFRDNQVLNCWRFERYYESLDGQPVYQLWARGEGPVVRHLCSDGRCVNQLHLLRGTDLDNARDEIEVRNFEIKILEDILDDYSMEGEEKDLIHLTLLPKAAVRLREERGVRTLKDTNNYVREFFRKDYVKRLVEQGTTEAEYAEADKRLLWLLSRDDIAVVTIPGV